MFTSSITRQFNSVGTIYILTIYMLLFLHINMTQVVEIPPRVRQGPAYST